MKIYNTLSGKLEEFIPLKPNKVSMYVCGPTVYNYIHIGNARPAIFFDTVRRYFEYKGYEVTYVQNFTDVDDKIIKKANEEGVDCKVITEKYIKAYFEDTAKVNLKEEGMIRPRATEYIQEMIDLIKILEEKGFAYAVNGDVYFNVEAYRKNYAVLIKQGIDDLLSGARIEVGDIKKSPLDFALWKSAKAGEPSWDSPWGAGRPGWHIECSAMSNKLLGATFDIHGGGQDLIFPHHENEIAQSKCSTGGDFARYWIHNGFINVKGEKMSKSLGNFFLLREVLEKYSGNVVRFFMLSSHYRKPINFSEDELVMASTGLERIINTQDRAKKVEDKNSKKSETLEKVLSESKKKFEDGMDDDFNTAIAIGAVFEVIKELNVALDKSENKVGEAVQFIKTVMEDVLGVKLESEKKLSGITEEEIEKLLQERLEARKNKDWATSDKIRDELAVKGIKIKDGKDQNGKDVTTWSV